MTKKDYLNILNSSQAFQNLSEETKEFYKNALEEKFEEYAGVFLKGQSFQDENRKELAEKNADALDNFKKSTKEAKKDLLVKSEVATKENEEQEGNLLLDQLNNLT